MLEVHITKNVTWTEEIPFTTEKTQSSDYAYGTTHTVQEGENGVRTITAQNVYDTEGNLLSQTITSSEVTKEPVTREIVVGTKLPSGSVAPGGQRHLHLACTQVYRLLALVFQQPQGRGHQRAGGHPHLRLCQRCRHQGRL